MAGNRAFLAFYGGPDPGPKLQGPRMDPSIALAYAVAVRNLGGLAQRGEREFEMTRAERLQAPGLVPYSSYRLEQSLARKNPNEIVKEIREGWVVIPAISDNTWLGATVDIASAVQSAVTILLHRNAKIDEIAFIDHGENGRMTFGTDVFDLQSVRSGGRIAGALRRLVPFIDENSVLTLGGCAVAEGAEGRNLAKSIAQLLNVRVQAFEEIQYINLNYGVEGRAFMCGPTQCTPGSATPFAETLYEGLGTKGGGAFGMKTPGWG